MLTRADSLAKACDRILTEPDHGTERGTDYDKRSRLKVLTGLLVPMEALVQVGECRRKTTEDDERSPAVSKLNVHA